jgi:hypothetical protein
MHDMSALLYLRLGVTLSVALFMLVGLAGCGGAQPSPVAVRVGDVELSERSIEHWTSIITRGALVANLTGSTEPTARTEALAFLISSAWLDGEAARDGLRPTKAELTRMINEQKNSTTNGAAGFAAGLAETGQTLADVEAETAARWVASALARRLAATAARYANERVGTRTVVNFYRSHLAIYHLRERRYYDLREWISSRAKAVALARKLGPGKRFSEESGKERPFRPSNFQGLPGQAIAYQAIFAEKKTGVIVGPLPLHGEWSLFVLRRIVPARLQPLSEVRGSIERRLLAPIRRRATAKLVEAYREMWTAQTDCRPGFVVQKCRQYDGKRLPEPSPFASF